PRPHHAHRRGRRVLPHQAAPHDAGPHEVLRRRSPVVRAGPEHTGCETTSRRPYQHQGGLMSRLGTIGGRLHRGEVSLDFVGRKKPWYAISGLILVISVASLLTLGLNFGVEFKGGTVFQFPARGHTSTAEARAAVKDSGVVKEDPIVQKTGTGWRIQTES